MATIVSSLSELQKHCFISHWYKNHLKQ